MKKMKFGAAILAVLLGGGAAIAVPLSASAHTPSVTDTCNSISATLTNYEYVEGKAAVTGTRVVTPAVEGKAAVYGPAPLIQAATPGSPGVTAVAEVKHTEYLFRHIITGKEKWQTDPNWNSGHGNDWGWYYTYQARVVIDVAGVVGVPAVPATPDVYGPAPLISPEVIAVAEVTETYEISPAVAAQDNTITLILDGVTTDVIHFGHSYQGTKDIDGSVDHEYTVIIDAIGTKYDVTINGETEACYVPPVVPEKPADTVTVVTTDAVDCDTDLVTSTTVTTTVGTELVDNKWVATEPVSVTTTSTRVLTAEEAEDCLVEEVPEEETPPVVDPPAAPPAVNPPAALVALPDTPKAAADNTASVKALAMTGQDSPAPAALIGVGIVLLGALFLLGRRIYLSRKNN